MLSVGAPYWISRGSTPWAVPVRGQHMTGIFRFASRDHADDFGILVRAGVDPSTAEAKVKQWYGAPAHA